MNNQTPLTPSPADFPSVGRRVPERSEGARRPTDGKSGPDPKAHPDPEVVAQAKRRHFTADYKLRILAQADQAKGASGVGALLRREGLYSSLLTAWRRERQSAIDRALTPKKRGPKSQPNPLQEENQKLLKENVRLTEELRKAAIVIDVQKKVGALLGWPTPALDRSEQL